MSSQIKSVAVVLHCRVLTLLLKHLAATENRLAAKFRKIILRQPK